MDVLEILQSNDLKQRLYELISRYVYEDVDPYRLRLKHRDDPVMQFVATQLECRISVKDKLYPYNTNIRFLFPSKIAAEQSSSTAMAEMHAEIMGHAQSVIDMTAGLGIDTLSFSRVASKVTAIELDPAKAACLRHNAELLRCYNIEVVNGDSVEYIKALADSNKKVDCIYIDPARRDNAGRRVYGFADCTPDVTTLVPLFKAIAKRVIVKASPMLDITHTIDTFPGLVSDIYITGTKTECKELVAVLNMRKETPRDEIQIHSLVDLREGICDFSTTLKEEREATLTKADYHTPEVDDILYMPSAPLMKSGTYHKFAETLNLRIVAPDTHLFIAPPTEIIDQYPGDKFSIIEVLDFNKRTMADVAKRYPSISVSTRGMGIKAEDLKQRLKVKEGDGTLRLIGIKDATGKRLMLIIKALRP